MPAVDLRPGAGTRRYRSLSVATTLLTLAAGAFLAGCGESDQSQQVDQAHCVDEYNRPLPDSACADYTDTSYVAVYRHGYYYPHYIFNGSLVHGRYVGFGAPAYTGPGARFASRAATLGKGTVSSSYSHSISRGGLGSSAHAGGGHGGA